MQWRLEVIISTVQHNECSFSFWDSHSSIHMRPLYEELIKSWKKWEQFGKIGKKCEKLVKSEMYLSS